jgi:hypothetical protein
MVSRIRQDQVTIGAVGRQISLFKRNTNRPTELSDGRETKTKLQIIAPISACFFQ